MAFNSCWVMLQFNRSVVKSSSVSPVANMFGDQHSMNLIQTSETKVTATSYYSMYSILDNKQNTN